MSATTIEGNTVQNDLVKRIKANDNQTLKMLYTANYPYVEKYVLNNSGSEDDAKDIFQEAFIATWRNIMLDKFTVVHEGSVNAYLFRIAKNKWMDVLRSKRKNISIVVEPGSFEGSTDSPTSDEENYVDQVKKEFRVMGEPCRELLERFYSKKESLRLIAIRFSWTEATAKNNKYRCLQKLRAAILNDK